MRSNLWRILFGIVIALVAPIVLSLVVAVLILSVPPIGRYALRQALTRVGPRFGLVVRFGRIEGNIMRSFTISDIAVKLGPDSLQARKVTLTYDPWASIAHRSFSASSASAVEPVFFMSSIRPASGQPGSGRSQYPPIRVGQFRMSDGSMYLDTVQRLDSVDFILNLVSEPTQLQARLSDVRARLRRERISLTNLEGSARLTPDSMIVTGLVAKTAASSLRAGLKMAFQPSAIAVRLESLSVSLPELTSAVSFGQRNLIPGRLSLTGTAKLEKNQGSGDMQFAAEGLAWQTIGLPIISGKLGLRDSVVQVTMAGADQGLGSAELTGRLDLRRFDFSGSIRLTGVAVRLLDSVLPDVRVDAGFEVSGRGFDSVVATAAARIPDLGIDTLTVAGSYHKAGGQVALEQLKLSGPIGALSGRGTWRGSKFEADVQADGFDLGLIAKLYPLAIQGRATGSMNLSGTIETLVVVSDLSVTELDIAGVTAARAEVDLSAAMGRELSGRVRVDVAKASYGGFSVDSVQLNWQEQQFELGVWQPGVHVAADGAARLARDSIGIDVAAVRIGAGSQTMTFNDALHLHLRHDSLNVELTAAGLAGGDVHVTLASAGGKPPRVEAAVRDLDLAKLRALFGLGFDVSGTVSLEAAGSDTFSLSLEAEHLEMPDVDVDLAKVEGRARISRTRTDFDHLWLVHMDSTAVPETSVVTGSVEYKTEGGFELGAADLRARLRNPGSWIVFYLKPMIELRQGNIYGDLSIKGGLTRPVFDGRVRISQARLGAPVIGATFDRVNAELVFNRGRINIEKLTGRSDHGNTLVTGFVDIGELWQVDSLRFHGEFSGTTINPQPEIYAIIGGSLDLNWSMGRPYALSGTVNVEEALIAFGFGQSAGTGTGAPDTSLTYDVRVKGDRNIWFRNQLADIELACDLTVRKTTQDVLYSGELTSRQGTIYYLDQALRVDSGSVKFANINTLNPDLDITAELPIRAVQGDVKVPDKIVLTLTGTLEKPVFGFTSEPPVWDEIQIASYMSLNVAPGQWDKLSASEQRNAVTKLLSQRLLNYFQLQVSKRARNFVSLDYLEFESDVLASNKQARVTVGKYVGRNLYVSYTQNLTGQMIPAFRVEYHINRKSEILAEGTPDDQYGYRTSLRYQLRFRY
jgi:autotransporter translocation and assembly factor TamB